MHRGLGVVIVTCAVVAALAAAFFLRGRAPGSAILLVLAASGAALGVGGAYIEADGGFAQAATATGLLAVLTPLHVRFVLGPLGVRRAGRP